MNTKTDFLDFIQNDLNPEQQKAATAHNGVFLVVAGAGSGKTRVITARIAHLILEQQASPASIVALTFTNKAGNEMKDRVKQFLPYGCPVPFVGTFHAYCLRLLKAYNSLLTHPFISILDEDDKHKLLTDIIKRGNLSKLTTASQLAYSISRIKNATTDGNIEKSAEFQFSMPFVKEAFGLYEREKIASKCLDFDDLLIEAVNLFTTNQEFKKQYQASVSHLLVDEYQDTNVIQHELLKHMCLANKKFTAQSLCVVGDEDQSIYSWRGATPTNFIDFAKDFPHAQTIKIEQNYRSVQPILDVANAIIKNNINRNPKKLWSEKKAHDRICVVTGMSEYQEGDIVAQYLKTARAKQKLSSIAILYRAHHQSRVLEEALIRSTIAYKIIGGIQFYERKEIKDLLAYLRLSINPFDRSSFFRIINYPTRGLGQKFEEEFYHLWNQEMLSDFKQVATQIISTGELTKTKKDSLSQFLNIFASIDSTTAPSRALEIIIHASGYFGYLKETYDEKEALSRIDNVKELQRAVRHLEDQGKTTIEQFLDDVALIQEKAQEDEERESDAVFMMTLHAAKGLEFHTIIIIGVEDGLLPSSRSLVDSEALEEERRLFYVGITRAKERLLLTHSKYRYTYGTMNSQPPSRFLAELPTDQFDHHDCSKSKTYQIDKIFSDWLGLTPQNSSQSTLFTFRSAAKTTVAQEHTPVSTTKPSITSAMWKKNQPVQHKKFGVGVIQTVEQKGDSQVYLMIKFKAGVKKVDSKFVSKV
jgi:DNA helicase II / ATP-dependent DNA helicase PcrA